MPAAAVIPAPIAYIKVVAVKKLVVGSRARVPVRLTAFYLVSPAFWPAALVHFTVCQRHAGTFTLKKLECSKQAIKLE